MTRRATRTSALLLALLAGMGLPRLGLPLAAAEDRSGYTGVVFAYRTADVSSTVGGVLRRYWVRLGDRVAAGKTMASLDRDPLERQLAIAEAGLRAARAEEAKAMVELTQAHQILERRKQVAWAESQEGLASLGARESLAQASLEVARSQVAEQSARVQKTRDDRAQCEVRAPFPGRIGRLHQSEGAFVTSGAPIVRLVADGDSWIRFAVPPDEASFVAPGKEVRVTDESAHQVLARVEHVAPEVDPAAGMVFVEARVNPKALAGWLRPGTVVRVFLSSAPGSR